MHCSAAFGPEADNSMRTIIPSCCGGAEERLSSSSTDTCHVGIAVRPLPWRQSGIGAASGATAAVDAVPLGPAHCPAWQMRSPLQSVSLPHCCKGVSGSACDEPLQAPRANGSASSSAAAGKRMANLCMGYASWKFKRVDCRILFFVSHPSSANAIFADKPPPLARQSRTPPRHQSP